MAGMLPIKSGTPQFIGTAVFRGDRMVGELSGSESMYLNMLTGNFQRGIIIIEDPQESGEQVGLTLRQGKKPLVKVSRLEEGAPVIDVELFHEPEITSISSNVNYEMPDLKKVLEDALREVIRNNCEQLVARTQEEFGRYFRLRALCHNIVFNWKSGTITLSEVYPTAT
jgi:hypothetical protein